MLYKVKKCDFVAKSSKYSKLSIEENKILGWIELWCEENLPGECDISLSENKDRIQYVINNDGNIIKIDFLRCNGGLITICPKVGTNIPISIQIADSIYDRVSNVMSKSPFSHGFSIILSEEDFNVIIELISNMDGTVLTNSSIQNEKGKQQYRLYKFTGPAKDFVVIKYYPNTSRMQLQGKPLMLFNEVVEIVSDNCENQNDVVDANIKYCNVDVKQEEIFEEMERILGSDLYRFLSTTQKIILSSSFILNRIDGYLGDYAILFIPANKTFEGFVKKIFAERGLQCEGKNQLGTFFKWDNDITPVMREEYASKLDTETERCLTGMFKAYSDFRHAYAHVSACDSTTAIVEDRRNAEDKFSSVIVAMKSWYERYKAL